MSFDLEKALARESRRLSPKIFEPVVVQTVGDIRRYVADLDPARSPPRDTVKLSTRMDVNDGTKTQTYAVSAVTHSKSKRDQLLEGMAVIKQMMDAPKQQPEPVEINGR